MNATKTKQVNRFFCGAILVAALGAAALFPSCKFNFVDTGESGADGGGPDCKMTVRFQESDQYSSASSLSRTVVPVIASNAARYDVQCLNAGGATIASASITAIASSVEYTFADLAPGTVTVKVKAYKDAAATALIAAGETTATLIPGNTVAATVTLAPVQTQGTTTGGFALTIKWPTASASTISWSLDGQAAAVLGASDIASAGGTSTATLSAANQDSGIHTIRIYFNENVKQTQLEIINVFDNLKSDKWIKADGTLADFREYTEDDVKPAAQAGSTEATLRILDGSKMETLPLANSAAVLSTSHVFAGTGITIITSAAIIGQKIEFKMNSGGWTTAVSDAPVGVAVTQDGSPQTLSVRVTGQSSATASVYQVNIRTPIHVSNEAQLLSAFSAMDNYIVLDSGFSLSSAWTPVGSSGDPYTGTFDGNEKTISGLTTADQDNAGLFGYVGTSGVVKNLTLAGVDMRNANNKKGAIAGQNEGLIYRCVSSGKLSGVEAIGGIAGMNRGTIEECWSNAEVKGSLYCGGLVGVNGEVVAGGKTGLVKNCYARGPVSAVRGGGLVGWNYTTGIVLNSFAAGCVAPNGASEDLQGLAGRNNGSQTNSHFDLSKIAQSYSGGSAITAGYIGSPESTLAMRTTGTYSGWDFGSVWTIAAGKNGGYPYLQHVTPTTDTPITDQSGLAAVNSAPSGDYYLANTIIVSGGWTSLGSTAIKFTGTLDGRNNAIQFNTPVAASLFGYVDLGARVENLHVAYPQGLSGGDYTAGISGYNDGTIDRCSVSGAITCDSNAYIAGIAGTNHGTINECYSNASISGLNDVGGIAGDNGTGGSITNCYNRGSVTGAGGTDGKIGGIIGYQWGSYSPLPAVSNCYSSGLVSGPTSGGAIGQLDSGTANHCFYDSERSLKSDTGKGLGITDDETRLQSTFTGAGWDFSGVWTIGTGKNAGYPYLRNVEPTTDIAIAGGNMTSPAFRALFSDVKADYIFNASVTLTDSGAGLWTPIGSFAGTINGNGHSISGLSNTDGMDTKGFIGVLGAGGLITNLKVCDVDFTDSENSNYAGALVGKNGGTISNCSSSGAVSVDTYGGGLVGLNNGLVEYCYSIARVRGNDRVGGLIGMNSGTVRDCYARGSVSMTINGGRTAAFAGGMDSGTMVNCYATGLVTCATSFNTTKSGFVGGISGGIISGCSFDADTTGFATGYTITGGSPSVDVTGHSNSDMTNLATFIGWNTSTVWAIDATKTINNGYPYLNCFGAVTVAPLIVVANIYNNVTNKSLTNAGGAMLTESNHAGTPNGAWRTTTASSLRTNDPDLIFSGTDAFTICGWFRIDNYGAGGSLFYRGGDSYSLNYGIFVQNGGTIQAQISESGVGGNSTSAYAQTAAQWFYVGLSYSGSSTSTLTLYVDGVSRGSVQFSYSGSKGSSFWFGGFNGAMSDLKIFNTALSAGNISNLYSTGSP